MSLLTSFKSKLLDVQNISQTEKLFFEFSTKLMNNYQLDINNTLFEFTEIEFYYLKSNHHDDTYTHANEKQKQELDLYVHKQPWTRGGVDLTFGDENIYGGILIRGLKHNSTYYSGPANSKRAIVEISNINIEKNYQSLQKYFDDKSNWELIKKDTTQLPILHSTRVGLGIGNLNYKNALYRFLRKDYLESSSSIKEKTKVKAISNLTIDYSTREFSAINEVKKDSILMKHVDSFIKE